MAISMSVAEAMKAQLNAVPEALRPPPAVFAQLLAAAGKLRAEGGADDAQRAAVIYKLTGWGAGYGDDPPPTSVSFPADHRMHLKSGNEWYWVAAHLDAEGPNGPARIAVLIDILRFRLISTKLQAEIGWSDADCQLVWSAATVTVSDARGSRIHRRRRNVQWPKTGGQVEFPGAEFVLRCGPDVMVGPPEVLPMGVNIEDGDNLSIWLRLTTEMPPTSAFFLQGTNGVTPAPRPGIYYSWPQLSARGHVQVGGEAYEASGSGWIDHQLLMRDPPTPMTPPPAIDGWNWCEFNFANGEAFTAAAFQTGMISVNPLLPYGFYLRPATDGQSWVAEPLIGGLSMDHLIPTLHQVMQATSWTYSATNFPSQSQALARPFDLAITTAPWIEDGSFETADLAVPSEAPVSAAMVNKANLRLDGSPLGEAVTGVGFCETVNWEPWAAYQARALAFLQTGADP